MSSAKPSFNIDYLIYDRGWSMTPEGLTSLRASEPVLLFTRDELTRMHPELPRALELVADHAARKGEATSGRVLVAQIYALTQQSIELVDQDGVSFSIADVSTFSWLPAARVVALWTTLFDMTTQLPEAPGKPLRETEPFVANAYKLEKRIPEVFLDNNYPGWRDRMAVGEALGVTGRELCALALGAEPAPKEPVSLDGVSFD